ncbi:MAG TPA: acido-empty-quinoprotein group A [Vicinamibacterales bacterium]|nr:acido-empty-quinoprotein group A [Vicinamibacterales bacterium]
MTRSACVLLTASLVLAPGLGAQDRGGLDPASIGKPLADSWLTYSGDYSGRRYSALTEINQSTVRGLTLAWVAKLTAGLPGGGAGGGRGGRGGGAGGRGRGAGGEGVIVGGEGAEEFAFSGAPSVKGSILKVGDVLYVTAPDNVWALSAHDGRELWRYFWKTRGGTHIGNRGAALWHEYLFFETPDNYLVSLDARTGKERWHVEIASFNEQYFSTPAPVVIDNHVLVGTGNDLDMPGFLQSFDPDSGKLQWKTYTVPMNPGDPGLDTWPSLEAARHGGAQTWIPGAYDPETRLYIIGTGNPTPGYTGQSRKGDNLYTCSIVAFNVDTGKVAWYYQTSPHDTHDWDSAQTPVLIDGVIGGQPRKLVSTASRNGYFFTLDRLTGKPIVSSKYGMTTNWAKGMRKNMAPEPDPSKEATVAGSLVSPVEGGVTNWPPPAFSPDTGFFYIHEHNGFNLLYLTETDPRGSMGLAGKAVAPVGSWPSALQAIDYRTGKPAWRHEFPGGSGGGGAGGILATAGKLVFTGDAGGNLVAFDAATGTPLWHSHIGSLSNAPETFSVDGRQHILVAVGDTLYAFALYQ